jgi:hypothetical protein
MDLPGPSLRPDRTVAYFYDADVGNYSYGYGHPMKPHRMRMTHNLVANYGLDRYMDILRPKRASREQMSAFHTDEYVDFLSRVSPETMADLTGESKQCKSRGAREESGLLFTKPHPFVPNDSQSWLERIVLHLRDCGNFVRSVREVALLQPIGSILDKPKWPSIGLEDCITQRREKPVGFATSMILY